MFWVTKEHLGDFLAEWEGRFRTETESILESIQEFLLSIVVKNNMLDILSPVVYVQNSNKLPHISYIGIWVTPKNGSNEKDTVPRNQVLHRVTPEALLRVLSYAQASSFFYYIYRK